MTANVDTKYNYLLIKHTWCNNRGYLITNWRCDCGPKTKISLHKLILNMETLPEDICPCDRSYVERAITICSFDQRVQKVTFCRPNREGDNTFCRPTLKPRISQLAMSLKMLPDGCGTRDTRGTTWLQFCGDNQTTKPLFFWILNRFFIHNAFAVFCLICRLVVDALHNKTCNCIRAAAPWEAWAVWLGRYLPTTNAVGIDDCL